MAHLSVNFASELILACLRLVRRVRASDNAARMTPTQASALAVIIYIGKIKISDLAEYEHVTKASISVTVGQLEKLRFVKRQQNVSDKRVSFLTATPTGKKVFEAGQKRHSSVLFREISKLSDADRRTLQKATKILMKLTDEPM